MLIGEVASHTGVSARMLRHWESLGLLEPEVRSTGYREYSTQDIQRIFHIEGLRSLGLSLKQIAAALGDPKFTPESLVNELIEAVEERLRQEQELLDRLSAVQQSGAENWEDAAKTVELLRALESTDPARRQVAALQGQLPTHALVGALLHEPSVNVLGALQWSIANGETGDIVEALSEHLYDDDPAVRLRVIRTLGKVPGAEMPDLTVLLDDPDLTVRRHAALTAVTPAAIPVLIDMATNGPNDVDAGEALAVLAQKSEQGEKIKTLLHDALLNPHQPTRIRLMQALLELPGELTEEIMAELAEDADPVIASMARGH